MDGNSLKYHVAMRTIEFAKKILMKKLGREAEKETITPWTNMFEEIEAVRFDIDRMAKLAEKSSGALKAYYAETVSRLKKRLSTLKAKISQLEESRADLKKIKEVVLSPDTQKSITDLLIKEIKQSET